MSYEVQGYDGELAAVHPQPQPPTFLEHAIGDERLNLGCGLYGLDGWHNVDQEQTAATDEVVNLNRLPWPWDSRSWDTVLLDNVLEHLADPLAVLWELYRITKPGGRILIRVPHKDSPAAYRPGHQTYWHEDSLTGFIDPRPAEARNPESDHLFSLVHQEVHHAHPWAWHQRKHLGREIIGWGKQAILWVLEPRASAHLPLKPTRRTSP